MPPCAYARRLIRDAVWHSPYLSSHAQIGQRMAISFGIEGSDSLVNGVGEVFAAGERLVCEMMPLQIAPYSLDGIELRGIFWQPFDAEPGRAGGQRGARRLAGVDGAVVEDEPDRLWRFAGVGAAAGGAGLGKRGGNRG